MRRWLVIILLILQTPGPARAQACGGLFAGGQVPALLNARLADRTTVLCNDAYAVLASGLTRGPLWSAEHLTRQDLVEAHATSRTGQFFEDDRLPFEDRALLSDYARSGYDRGHMTPSGDMPDQVSQQQSFALSNVVPQTAALNRDTWEGIESAVRHLAQRRGELYVVTGPAYQGTDLQALKGRVLVPTSTWKAVYDPAMRGAAAYLCSNVIQPRCSTLSIAALARTIGVDPFPGVAEPVKRVAMRLPRPEPSPYARHHRRSQPGVLDWLLK